MQNSLKEILQPTLEKPQTSNQSDSKSDRLRKIRFELGLTQGKIAKMLNLDQGLISKVESGKVSITRAGCFRLVSENPDYDPYDIPIDRIERIFLVKGKLEKSSL